MNYAMVGKLTGQQAKRHRFSVPWNSEEPERKWTMLMGSRLQACCPIRCGVDYSVLLACSACSLLITLPCCCAVRWFCPTLKGNPYRKFIVWWITLSCLLQCLFTASKLCLAGGGHKFARLLCCDTGITCLLLLCFEGESLPKIQTELALPWLAAVLWHWH